MPERERTIIGMGMSGETDSLTAHKYNIYK